MPVTLHSFVAIYTAAIDATLHLLDKGAAFAAANGEPEDAILAWRLADDMHPLSFQAAVVADFSAGWTARVADQPVPERLDFTTATVASLREALTNARASLIALTPELFVDRDDVELTVQLGNTMEPTMTASRWITGFATVNIHFHMSMVYAILRMKGVSLGKIDLFPKGL